MNLINNNPYRILGLLAGTKASEQSRQVKRLKQFIEAEQEPDADFSFPILGDFSRTLESVAVAEQKINLDSDKINAALFWFYNGNAITDEPAFDFLTDGNIDDAKSIWLKLTITSDINERNASAFHNLSNLLLCNNHSSSNNNELDFEQGIILKLQLLDSEFYKKIIQISTDITYKATKNEIQLLLLNQLKAELEKGNNEKKEHFIQILNKQTFAAKEDFFKSFVEKPIEQIEKRIAETITKRKADKTKSADFGSELYSDSQKEISQIKDALGVSNPKFITISDKLANEILQCSFIAFNHFQNTETEIGETVFELINKAKSIAIGSIIKDRIKENLPNIEAYIKRKPEREKLNLVKDEIEFINSKIETFQNLEDKIINVTDLIESCKPKLYILKRVLGSNDDLYLHTSDAIVSNAEQMAIRILNEEFKSHNNWKSISKESLIKIGINAHYDSLYYDIKKYKENLVSKKWNYTLKIFYRIEEVLDIFHKLDSFDMTQKLNLHYLKNFNDIKNLAIEREISILSPKEKIIEEIKIKEYELSKLINIDYKSSGPYSSELDKNYPMGIALDKLKSLKKWQIINRNKKINDQEQWIQEIINKRKVEINVLIIDKEKEIEVLKNKLKQLEN